MDNDLADDKPGFRKGATEAALVDKSDELQAEEARRTGGGASRGVMLLVAIAAGWIAIQGIQGLQDIVAPVFLGLNLMIAAYPLKKWVQRKGGPEWLGAAVAFLTVLGILVAFFWSLGWAVAAFANSIPEYKGQFVELYQGGIRFLARFGISEEQLTHGLQELDPGQFLGVAQKALSSVTNVASLLAVVATVLIFMLMDSMHFEDRMGIASAHNPTFTEALGSFALGVRKYWVVSTVFGLIVALLDLGVLLAAGVPLAAVWAVLSFVTNYIPNIGFVIGLVPPALMALLARGPVAALAVVVAYAALNFFVQSVIQPKFAGDAVGVTPTVSFLSLLFWAFVMGPLGAILALPATLLVKAIIIDADPANRWMNAFIAAKPKSAGRPMAAVRIPARLSRGRGSAGR